LAALITAVLALNNFTVPALLQVRVLPAAIWVDFSSRFDAWAALKTGWPLVAAPVVLLAILVLRPGHAFDGPRADPAASAGLVGRQLGRGWGLAGRLTVILLGVASLGLPMVQLVFTRDTWMELPGVIRAVPGTLFNSFLLALAAAAGCLGVALVSWRWKAVGAVWLMFFIPGTLLGMGWIGLLNRPTLQWLYQSVLVVVLAWGIRFLPLAWMAVRLAMQRADRDVTDAARLQGASGWPLLRRIHWPQIASPSAAAAYMVYVLCLWDVETLILIVPPGGETLALRVFNLLHYGHNAQVNAMCVLLLALALGPAALWSVGAAIQSRRGSHEA
jgi:ABC-type Fe3+ transport system permease subunit